MDGRPDASPFRCTRGITARRVGSRRADLINRILDIYNPLRRAFLILG